MLVLAMLGAGACELEIDGEEELADPIAAECLGMSAPVYHKVNPTSRASLYTISAAEAAAAASQYGFTEDRGAPFLASATARTGLAPVYRLFKPSTGDFLWTIDEAERASARSRYGYADQGVNFFASAAASGCSTPVYRFVHAASAKHRFAVTATDREALAAAGWRSEGIQFYAASGETAASPPPTTPPPSAPTAPPPSSGGSGIAGLDASGATIPDTNYPIPSGAVFMATNGDDARSGTLAAPVKSLARALALVPTGGTIVVRGGVYRDGHHPSVWKTFHLQPYPHEQAWFDGTDVVTGWQSHGNGQWSVAWSTPNFCGGKYYDRPYRQQTAEGPCAYYDQYNDTVNPASADPQMVFFDGVYVHEVTSLAEAVGSNFFYDQAGRRLYIGRDPNGHTVELAARASALVLEGGTGGNTIRGIGFRRFASNQLNMNRTHGAVMAGMPNLRFEHNVFTANAGAGLQFADPRNAVVYRNVFAKNGANGMDANGHQKSGTTPDNMTIESNVFNQNNTERFGVESSYSTDAAGMKACHMNGFTLKNNVFQNAVLAKGFWCDMACSNGVMVGNVFANNDDAGLFYEISDTGIIASNLMYGNGGNPSSRTSGNGGYGLKVGSANTKIYNNTIVDNRLDVLIYDDARSHNVDGWTDAGPDTANVRFVNNIMSGSAGKVSAWRTNTTAISTGPNTFFSELDYNAYHRPNATPAKLYDWRDGSGLSFNSCGALTAAKGWEGRCLDLTAGGDPFFVDPASRDYRVRPDSPAYLTGKPLPSDVAAALGIPAGQAVSRGALNWVGRP